MQKRQRLTLVCGKDRFWAKVEKTEDCWNWTGFIGTGGYGYLRIGNDRSPKRAHRISYELHFGPITDPTLYVCHHCDNPRCVRPEHLFLGTAKENSQDMVNKDRQFKGPRADTSNQRRGENHYYSKLTAERVMEIRSRFNAGVPRPKIAREFGINLRHVYKVGNREVWFHI